VRESGPAALAHTLDCARSAIATLAWMAPSPVCPGSAQEGPVRCAATANSLAGVVYDLLMKAAAETTLAIAADPKRPRADPARG
jgi:hypothetical protein